MKKVNVAWADGWTGKPPPPLESVLHLAYDEHTYGGEVCEGQEDDPWPSHEDETKEFFLHSCSLTSDKAQWMREQFRVDFAPEVGSTVFAVVVRYATGGTFGRTNGCWDILGVFRDITQADQLSESVYDGTYDGYKCWVGFFESFEQVEICHLVVGP